MHIKNIAQAQELLEKFIPSTKPRRYTLDRMQALMTYLDNPQDRLKVVHIAGTSGKTSTSYYAAALLLESGFRVGLSISPHIDSVSERAQVNLQTLPEQFYCEELGIFLDLVQKSTLRPSYFELLVAFSYWLFDRQKVDYAVVEVGLGGLLDGTNVVHRKDKICLISDIGFDHTEILGNTLSEIAAQKAGIIHEGNRVFMHNQASEVMTTIKKQSLSKAAELTIIEIDDLVVNSRTFEKLPEFQQRNFSLAYSALRTIVSPRSTEAAMQVHVPARMEEVDWLNKTIVLDGSHNEQKIKALVAAIKRKYIDKNVILVVSFGENKYISLENNLTILREVSDHIVITKFYLGQDEIRKPIEPLIIADLAASLGFKVLPEDNPEKAFTYALGQTEDIVLVTGSFYLLNHIRPLIKQIK